MRYIVILFIIFLMGCEKPALSVNNTNNDKIQVEFLFERDGIKVYRFQDNGYNRYFTTKPECQNDIDVSNGKIVTHSQSTIN